MDIRRRLIQGAAALLLSAWLSACLAPGPTSPVASDEPSPVPTATEAPQEESTEPPATSPVVAQARQDLASRLGAPLEQVLVVSVTRQEMPVGSLGCDLAGSDPQPGFIIGEEIRLSANGLEYTYRSDGRRLLPCSPEAFPGGREPAFAAGTAAAELRARQAALTDLAARIDAEKSAIQVISVEAVEWSDSGLGCPKPGMMYAQVITPGYRIQMVADGVRYEYHTGGEQLVLCAP